MGRTSQTVTETGSGGAAAADILNGYQAFAATTAATTVITIPAGRTWVGVVAISCATYEGAGGASEGMAVATVSVAGAGATPAAGTVMVCRAVAALNAATGLTGSDGNNALVFPLTVIAPAGNAVTVQAAATATGSQGLVDVACLGALQ